MFCTSSAAILMTFIFGGVIRRLAILLLNKLPYSLLSTLGEQYKPIVPSLQLELVI